MMMMMMMMMMILMITFIHTAPISPIETMVNSTIVTAHCQQALTYEEIVKLLAIQSCAFISHRVRRGSDGTSDDQTVASTNNIYALQSTINDHRTMIDDHRKMIYYLMNNTINVTQLSQHYSDQHVHSAPIWQSWRDLSLVFLLIICFIMLIYLSYKRLRCLDRLTTILIHRQHHQEQVQIQSTPSKRGTSINNPHRRRPREPQQPIGVPTLASSMVVEPMAIANVTRDYTRHRYDSNDF